MRGLTSINQSQCGERRGGDLNLCDNLPIPVGHKRHKYRCLVHIEVKAFVSDGPISYGPTETWGVILYVDIRQFIETGILRVYQLNESNTSGVFQSLPLKKKTDTENGTFAEQVEKKRRPRLSFEPTKEYFGERMVCIFNGSLEELLSHAPQST